MEIELTPETVIGKNEGQKFTPSVVKLNDLKEY